VNGLYDSQNVGYDDGGARAMSVALVAVMTGIAIGAAAALLLAPKSGQDLRDVLLTRAGDWKAILADTLSSGREKLVDSVERDALK